MHDAARVGGGERVRHGNGDAQRFAEPHARRGISASRLLPRTYSTTRKSTPLADSIS